MKTLIAFTIVVYFAILPNYVTAKEVWKEGDKVATFFVCREEKDIMDVALADSKSRENFSSSIVEKQITKGCFALRPPLMFIVDKVIGSYKDYKGVETTIMKIIAPKNNLLVGYIVAAGTPYKGI
tara:strand:+ start:128 stop:502 length:375 start_codon:yes stop_codon:yes gene_type:complete